MVHKTFDNLPEEKRNRILAAARSEFIRFSYEKSSINRILDQAGVPKGSFYQYFDNKSDLFCLCIMDVYQRLILEREKRGELLLQSGLLRMKKLGFQKGYELFSKDLTQILSKEDFALFENMLSAPRYIRSYVQTEAASSLIAPIFKKELMEDPHIRKDIDYDYYAYLLAMSEVVPIDYGTREGRTIKEIMYLSFQYMMAIYSGLMIRCPV